VQITPSNESDLDRLRDRLRNMNDQALRRFGRGAMELCSETDPREEFVVQLREARAEWQRRHSGGATQSHRAMKLSRP
jgi:hypothetical protein